MWIDVTTISAVCAKHRAKCAAAAGGGSAVAAAGNVRLLRLLQLRLANFIADEFEEKTLTQAEVRTLTEAKQKLEEAQIAHVAGKQDEAKNIVDTLHNLYTNYGNNSSLQEEHQKASLSEWLSANPSALKALTPIVVAASGIYKRTADAAIANGSRALDGALAKIELMNKQNAAARNMYPTAHPVVPQVQPNWQSAAVPVADVAATGARQEAPKFRMPAIFSTGMASFNESGGVGRVVQSQYDRNLNSHQGRA